jgi:carbamoyl-phosphate synthase large subunit
MNKREVVVMVTGVGGGGHGEQIVKALRLGQLRYRIIGTDTDPDSSGFRMVDEAHRVPRADSPDYIDTVLALCERHGARALFHGSEPEMYALQAHRSRFEDAGIYLPINRSHVMDVCRDKVETVRFLASHGFSTPLGWEIREPGDAARVDRFPVVLKPAVGGGGSANVAIAQDAEELLLFATHLLKHASPLAVQEYVGTPDAEFTVGVLFGADGALINSIATRRLLTTAISVRLRVPNRTARHDLGPMLVVSSGVSQGEVGRWPEVTGPCERIAAALLPNAPVNIQCRLVDGRVVPFEINPRFSGTTSLRAMAGFNEPDVLVRRDVFGESIDNHFAYDSCVIMRGLQEHRMGARRGDGLNGDPR